MYPKFGPGQMWEEVARAIRSDGGSINTGLSVESITHDGTRVTAVRARNEETGEVTTYRGSYFFSTMPIQELIRALEPAPPANVREVSDGLVYRDFITVGLLLNDLKIKDDSPAKAKLIQDNWIYVQEPDVQIGRLQIFNNWSPFLVADPTKVWLGLEYFCNETDPIWKLPDEEMIALAKKELSKIGIIEETEVLDGTVLRVPKTYPAYFGTYSRFDEIRSYIDTLQNLFLIGRNGMHKYNNQDHSMLTAMTAVDNIIAGRTDKGNIWEVNTEQDYHEQKQQEKTTQAVSA
jgi:protoporphyrinogen oxidase